MSASVPAPCHVPRARDNDDRYRSATKEAAWAPSIRPVAGY
jgi:hypothetical protein